jgi:hypothetical protein
MERIRLKYPCHIPCRFITPHGELKLLLPKDSTQSHAMAAVRQRWSEQLTPADALFCFIDGRMVCGNRRLSELDTRAPEEIVCHVRKENTFGAIKCTCCSP